MATGITRILLWIAPLLMAGAFVYVGALALKTDSRRAPALPAVSNAGFPVTVREADGRTVVIAQKPQRIIAANAGFADVLAVLVGRERILAVPSLVDEFAGDRAWFRAHREIKRFERYDAEVILALRPDLVLTSSFQEPGTTEMLQRHAIAILRFEQYKTMDGIMQSIQLIGRAVGEEQKAGQLVADMQRRLQAVSKAVAGRPRPRVLSYSNYGQGFAVGTGESQDEIIAIAGARNAAADMQLKGHVNFSFEQMLKLNPDWLIVSGDEGLESPQVRILLNEPTLANLPALKERRIAVIPDNVYSTISQHIVAAVEMLARRLHPEAFPAGGASASTSALKDCCVAPPHRSAALSTSATPAGRRP